MEESQNKRRKAHPMTGGSSEHDSGDENKRRGRPRVEKQDESAADRRRTQIRMAQRAYRQRKESTLDDLRKRVSVLTNSLEMLNKAFTDCRDSLVTSGLSELQMTALRDTTNRFEALMTEVRNPDAGSFLADRSSPSGSETQAGTQPSAVVVRNVPSWLDQSTLNAPSHRESGMEVGMGYTMYPETTTSPGPTTGGHLSLNSNIEAMFTHPFTAAPPDSVPYDLFRPEMADSGQISCGLSPPATYSFQESSFGRRLHRAGIEAGYFLLVSKDRRPRTFERAFRLSLMTRSEKQLLTDLKDALKRGPHEDLNLHGPRVCVGGAGTHYARRDPFGNLLPKKPVFQLGNLGPQTLAFLESAVFNNKNADMTVNVVGYEGSWFDPYDVEGYLEEKGIQIDPMSSFAEAEVDLYTPSDNDSSASSCNNLDPSPTIANSSLMLPFDVEQLHELDSFDRSRGDTPQWQEMSFPNVGFSDAQTGSWIDFGGEPQSKQRKGQFHTLGQPWEGSGSTEVTHDPPVDAHHGPESFVMTNLSPHPMPRTKRIIVDVAKFVKVLTLSGVCLGNGPGFRKRDVDRALAMASFDV